MPHIKESVAIVIEDDKGNFLAVKRADNDSFASRWGLPAASLRTNESHADTVKRAAKDKLGVDVKILGTVGDMSVNKGEYIEHLTEYLVRITNGVVSLEPRDPSVSQYAECAYFSDPSVLAPIARDGSICSRIFLKSRGESW